MPIPEEPRTAVVWPKCQMHFARWSTPDKCPVLIEYCGVVWAKPEKSGNKPCPVSKPIDLQKFDGRVAQNIKDSAENLCTSLRNDSIKEAFEFVQAGD